MSTSTDAAGLVATPVVPDPPTDDPITAPGHDEIRCAKTNETLPQKNARAQAGFLQSPPDSNNNVKSDASDSELSDLEEEPILSDAPIPDADADAGNDDDQDDIGEVLPDHWSGTVPVFKPTMDQFKDFQRFMKAVDSYGMKSGIIKIIPPQEWKDSLRPIDELVKRVKVREPIKQDIMGSSGTYRQVNILHGRSYNLPQWRQLCDQSEHQPPARRGERRANADRVRPTRARATAPKPISNQADSSDPPKKRGRGRPPKAKQGGKNKRKEVIVGADSDDRPMTPISPNHSVEDKDKPIESTEAEEIGEPVDDDDTPKVGRMGAARQAKSKTQSISARRKFSRREGSAMIDEAAFKDWDYRMDISEFTPERCEELERVYWKTLTYAAPLYGADLMGTLFDESTELWNLNKLPNLLDVLGTKVPGVNTAYLYMGMWKATFAWHLEDVDLYSINYLHFGAPKQWYSISQADARRFEAAMKSIWPQDAKACDQFLRHKAFLISPQHLKQHYGIQVNKCLSYPGEFVVTYPYGYHSGYNLGYNCAEAVNFALDSWLEMGKIAKKCDCAQAQDSVWVNVYEIERKLRGESTEYEATEDEGDEDDELSGLPTPPASHGVKFKDAGRKRKRGTGDTGKTKAKKLKFRLRTNLETFCCLCPNEFLSSEFLPTDDGRRVHKLCAMYLPETYIDTVEGKDVVFNVQNIGKERMGLRCMYCRLKRGACFQCSQKTCARSYHATCAAAAGVFVEQQDVPVFGDDNIEYKEQAFEFSCRFHRTKRDKRFDEDTIEMDERIQSAAASLQKGDTCQLQYLKGDIFAGCVVENRQEDKTLLLDILPDGDRFEVEWKWLLLPHPMDYHLPKASANAIPMPTSRKAKEKLNAKRKHDATPRGGDIFVEGCTWAEFQSETVNNPNQAKIDLDKPEHIWYYLGNTSTEHRAQFTEDASNPRHNPRSNFMHTVPKPPRQAPFRYTQPPAYGHARPNSSSQAAQSGGVAPAPASTRPEKPYVYKPRKPMEPNLASPKAFTTQRFRLANLPPPQQRFIDYPQGSSSPNLDHLNLGTFSKLKSDATTPQNYTPQSSGPRFPAVPEFVGRFHQQLSTATASSGQNIPPGSQGHGNQATPLTVAQQPTRSQFPPHSKAAWQVHTSIYQKYQFFQVNYNRESSKYRTPYAPWGGFTNGYEGNIRAHVMSNQNELLRRASSTTGTNLLPNYASGAQPTAPSFRDSGTYPLPNCGSGAQPTPPSFQDSGTNLLPNCASGAQLTPPFQDPGTYLLPNCASGAQPTPPSFQDSGTNLLPNYASGVRPTPLSFQDFTPDGQSRPPVALQSSSYGTNPFSHSLWPGSHTSPPQDDALMIPQFSLSKKTDHHPPAPDTQQVYQQISQWQAPKKQNSQPRASHQPTSHLQAPEQSPSQHDVRHVTQPRPQPSKPKSTAASGQKAYKICPKESPVPLPANFLAAITSTMPTLAATTAQAQLTATATSTLKESNQTSTAARKQRTAPSPGKSVTSEGSKISTTPVPIPQLPGMAPASVSVQHSPFTDARDELSPESGRTMSTSPTLPISQKQSPPASNNQQTNADLSSAKANPQSFADVPGGGYMDFVERLMQNLRRVSQRGGNS